MEPESAHVVSAVSVHWLQCGDCDAARPRQHTTRKKKPRRFHVNYMADRGSAAFQKKSLFRLKGDPTQATLFFSFWCTPILRHSALLLFSVRREVFLVVFPAPLPLLDFYQSFLSGQKMNHPLLINRIKFKAGWGKNLLQKDVERWSI